jgi:hypothetical protein
MASESPWAISGVESHYILSLPKTPHLSSWQGNQFHWHWVSRTPLILWNQGSDCKYCQPTDQCNPWTHASSNCKPTPIPSLDVYQSQFIGWHPTWGSSLHLYSGQWTVPTIPLFRQHPLSLPFMLTWLCWQMLTSFMAHWQSSANCWKGDANL